MPFPTVEKVKRHLRVYHVEEDEDISDYMGAAQEQLERMVGISPLPDSRLLHSAFLLLCSDLYENRQSFTLRETYQAPLTAQKLVNQFLFSTPPTAAV